MTSRLRSSTPGASALLAFALAATGCATAGPDYQRPATTVPDTFRGAIAGDASSIADEPWGRVFPDAVLQQLIAQALAGNLSARIAATRVLAASAQPGITRADQLPTVTGQVAGTGQRGTIFAGQVVPLIGIAQINAGVSWELDFWGRFRRATEAAREELAASTWGQRAIVTSLVSDVAAQYYLLRALDLQLEVTTRTLAAREESLRLTELRERGGVSPLVDVRQAEQLVHQARGQLIDLQRRVAQVEHALSLLLGRVPGPITRGEALLAQPAPPELPVGLPASLLERRPDVQEAERRLAAATARIGVAEAARLPQISLTGAAGVASTSLADLLTSGTWSVGSALLQPIFNAGRLRNRVAVAEAQAEEAALGWQATVLRSLREVSDGLVAYQRQREARATQELLVAAARDARRLADLRYRGGASSYLEVLDSESRLFTAEIALAQAQLAERAAYVELYRALGGGWQS